MNKTKNGTVAGALRTAASLVEESWDDPETIRIIAEANRIVKNILHVDAENDEQGATSITICGTEHQEGDSDMSFPSTPQPDLRTLEGQLSFLDYHVPDEQQQHAHAEVNRGIQAAWTILARVVPDGPGKTRLLHKMQAARMEANCVIANYGA